MTTFGQKIKEAREREFPGLETENSEPVSIEGDDLYYKFIKMRDPLIPLNKMIYVHTSRGDMHLEKSETFERGSIENKFHRILAARCWDRALEYERQLTAEGGVYYPE